MSTTSLRSGASAASLQQAANESNGDQEVVNPAGSEASTPSKRDGGRERRRRRRTMNRTTSTKTILTVSVCVGAESDQCVSTFVYNMYVF